MSPSPTSSSTTAGPPTIASAVPSPRLAPQPLDSVASTPRASVSQEDLLQTANLSSFAATVKRRAQWLRSHAQRGRDGPTGSAAETAVVVDPRDVVESALFKYRQQFSTLFTGDSSWSQSLPPLYFEELCSRIETNLDRVGSFSRGYDGVGKPNPSHWESTKKNIETLQKINGWLKQSSHPLLDDVLSCLWRGVGAIFDYLANGDRGFPRGILGDFCKALQELSVVLPSSLYHVSRKEDLLEVQVQAVTGLIYSDILSLVGSLVKDVLIPGKPHAGDSSSGSVRHGLLGKARDHSHHGTGGKYPLSINTNVARATGSTPGSPIGNTATKQQITVSEWKNNLRRILEQVGYHSKLLHSELQHLQAKEQSGRFGKISKILNEVEKAEKIEKDCRRALQSLGSSDGQRAQPQRRGSDSSGSSEGLNGGANINEDFEESDLAGVEDKRKQLEAQYRAARKKKDEAFTELRKEAGHIKCDVCMYTGFDREDTDVEGKNDHDVFLTENLREFRDRINQEASGSTESKSSSGAARKPLFKIYITNDNTIETLQEIAPRFMLNNRAKKALNECPNLWDFAKLDKNQKIGWNFIRTTLPNLEKGFGAEANRYAMEARDETEYFYDTTWKIYWCQPRSNEPNACPVAILVLAGNDVPLSRPIDPSPEAQSDMQKARKNLVDYYRQQFHAPLIEHGTIRADNLAVQILAETKRRWREVLDKMRHFVDVLTTKLYVEASNSSMNSAMGVTGQRQAAKAIAAYNDAAAQVFKILIRLNSYESFLIETMSYISQLADKDVILGNGNSNLDLLEFNEDDDFDGDDGMEQRETRPMGLYSRSNTRSLSRSGLLRPTAPAHRVPWREIARGHQDLLASLKSTKRQADSLKGLIDHQHSIYESRVSNQLSYIANFHAAEASRQADEAAAQNASMRRLTVVTFIFLPLTFMASLFGTNVEELGQGPVPIWMFFAIGVPFAAIVLAAWGYLEYWHQDTKSEGKGGELSGRSRVEEVELQMQRQGGLIPEDEDEDNGAAGVKGPWEGGDRMV